MRPCVNYVYGVSYLGHEGCRQYVQYVHTCSDTYMLRNIRSDEILYYVVVLIFSAFMWWLSAINNAKKITCLLY